MKREVKRTIGGILLLFSPLIAGFPTIFFEINWFSIAGVAIMLLGLLLMGIGVCLLESEDKCIKRNEIYGKEQIVNNNAHKVRMLLENAINKPITINDISGFSDKEISLLGTALSLIKKTNPDIDTSNIDTSLEVIGETAVEIPEFEIAKEKLAENLDSNDDSFEDLEPLQTRKMTEDDMKNAVKNKMTWEEINELSMKDQRQLRTFLECAREREKKRRNLKTLEAIAYNIRELKNNDENYSILNENPNENDLRDYLIFKYKPTVFYNQNFKFSKDIQKTLTKKLLLLEGEIDNIYKENGKNYIKFLGLTGLTSNDESFFDLTFPCKLEITEKQLIYIKNNIEEDFFNNFFIIASIMSLSCPEVNNNDKTDDNKIARDIFLSGLFSLEGKLVDIIKDE